MTFNFSALQRATLSAFGALFLATLCVISAVGPVEATTVTALII